MARTGHQYDPQISGSKMVWSDERNGNLDVYVMDLVTGVETQLTSHAVNQNPPHIDGNLVTYSDHRNGVANIYVYNLATNVETRLPVQGASFTSFDGGRIQISGDNIVWTDNRGGNFDVYAYNLITGQQKRITDLPSMQVAPDISGNTIVWLDRRSGGPGYELYAYDLLTGVERRVGTTTTAGAPRLDGSKLVWPDSRVIGDQEIYMFDLASNTETRITTKALNQWAPEIDGDIIVWMSATGPFFTAPDVWSYNLRTGVESQVTANPASQSVPVISGNYVAWEDQRNGNYDIYGIKLVPQIATIQTLATLVNGLVGSGELSVNDGKPLIASIEAAERSLERGADNAALGQLGALDNKVRALVRSGRLNSTAAETLLLASGEVQGSVAE